MSLTTGARLGPYEITAPLGAGGMGEVYRATDTRLGREVALKLLPEAFAADPDRLARFEREAKLLGSLSHPSIATLFGLELLDGQRVLAMELVEGEDLAERLKHGVVPAEETVAIARQIAAALEEAHEKGIVHRDLKPANVKLTPDGKVKVLDFGLAKAWSGNDDPLSGSAPALSQSPTLARTGTAAGLILGTAAYMSPEQARGKAVDKRSDIWAFGVVLFEMLAGRRLFDGETVTDVLAAVVKEPIAWSALPATTPASLRRLLERCLERDPKVRLRDMGEARIALARPATVEAPSATRTPRSPWPLAAAALAIAMAAAAAGWNARRPAPPEVRKLDVAAEGLSADEARRAVLSPDGRRIAYFAKRKIHVRDLDRAEARELPGTEGAAYAFWSPDGRTIGFYREETLFRLGLDAPAPITVARTGIHVSGAGACWTPDGRIVYSRGNTGLFEVRAEGGEPRVLLEPDRQSGDDHFHGCSLLPGDRGLVFVVHPKSALANTIGLLADGRSRSVLLLPGETVADPAWSPSGHIVFGRTGAGRDGVWALPFSLERLEPTGEPFQVVAGAGGPSVGADGSLLYTRGQISRAQSLVWVSREGTIEGSAAELPDQSGGLALSPDGKRIAVAMNDGGLRNIWAIDVGRGTPLHRRPPEGLVVRRGLAGPVPGRATGRVPRLPERRQDRPRADGLRPVAALAGRPAARGNRGRRRGCALLVARRPPPGVLHRQGAATAGPGGRHGAEDLRAADVGLLRGRLGRRPCAGPGRAALPGEGPGGKEPGAAAPRRDGLDVPPRAMKDAMPDLIGQSGRGDAHGWIGLDPSDAVLMLRNVSQSEIVVMDLEAR